MAPRIDARKSLMGIFQNEETTKPQLLSIPIPEEKEEESLRTSVESELVGTDPHQTTKDHRMELRDKVPESLEEVEVQSYDTNNWRKFGKQETFVSI